MDFGSTLSVIKVEQFIRELRQLSHSKAIIVAQII